VSRPRVVVVQQTRGSPRRPGVVEPVLEGYGFEAQSVRDDQFEPVSRETLIWLYGSVNWYPRTLERLVGLSPAARPPVVLWHSEPLPLPSAAGLRLAPLHVREIAKVILRDSRRQDPASNFRALRQLLAKDFPLTLVVSAKEKQEFLAEHGIDSAFVPLGYREDVHGRPLGMERDVDVLFLGARDVPRRKRILRKLRGRGVEVVERGGWRDPSSWGENRTQLLNRTKILLNIPRHPGLLSGYRMILGMANKALVLAEPIYRPEPYAPGVHYLSAPLEDMPDVITDSLADEPARTRMTDCAYDFVRTSLTLEGSVGKILALADGVR